MCFVDSMQSEWEYFFMATVSLGTMATMLSVKPRLVAMQNSCIGHRANNELIYGRYLNCAQNSCGFMKFMV